MTIVLLTAAAAQGVPTFSNAIGGSDVAYVGNTVTWGIPYQQPLQSGLQWTEAAFVPTVAPFSLGTITHWNYPQSLRSSPSAVDMTIFGAVTFTLSINETPNNPVPVDDIIGFPSVMPAWGNIEIIGFGPSASNILPSFASPEGGTNSTEIWAKAPERIPAPGALLLAAIGCLWVRRRRI